SCALRMPEMVSANARGAKGAGHRRWVGSTGNGRNLTCNGRRQPSHGGTSRMMREHQVRICERLGVQFPGPTRHADIFRNPAAIEEYKGAPLWRGGNLLQLCRGLLWGFYGLLVNRDDDITGAEADVIGGATGVDAGDCHALHIFSKMELSPKLIIQWSEMHSHRVCASRFLLFLPASSRRDLIAVGEFTYCCLQFDDLTISPNFHCGVAIRCSSSDKPRQIVQPADFAPVKRQDNVALLQAGLCTGAVLGNNRNNSAVLALQ